MRAQSLTCLPFVFSFFCLLKCLGIKTFDLEAQEAFQTLNTNRLALQLTNFRMISNMPNQWECSAGHRFESSIIRLKKVDSNMLISTEQWLAAKSNKQLIFKAITKFTQSLRCPKCSQSENNNCLL